MNISGDPPMISGIGGEFGPSKKADSSGCLVAASYYLVYLASWSNLDTKKAELPCFFFLQVLELV